MLNRRARTSHGMAWPVNIPEARWVSETRCLKSFCCLRVCVNGVDSLPSVDES